MAYSEVIAVSNAELSATLGPGGTKQSFKDVDQAIQNMIKKLFRDTSVSTVWLFVSLLLSLGTIILCQLANYHLISGFPSPAYWDKNWADDIILVLPWFTFSGAVTALFIGALIMGYSFLFDEWAAVFCSLTTATLWVIITLSFGLTVSQVRSNAKYREAKYRLHAPNVSKQEHK